MGLLSIVSSLIYRGGYWKDGVITGEFALGQYTGFADSGNGSRLFYQTTIELMLELFYDW